MSERPFLLVDSSSLAYRAYHAMPGLRSPDGAQEVSAVHGFLGFLARLVRDRRPERLACAFDADWRPQWRVAALPSYKSHRVAGPGDPPDPVEPQLEVIAELLEALGVAAPRADEYEAEDVIATLAARASGRIEIVTGDRDLFALVRDPDIVVLYTLRGVSEIAVVDEAWIRQRYGIPGDRYLDFALLRGDPSDGLPGVAGIGEKSASALIAKYGSLEGVLAAPDLSPTVRARLRSAAGYLEAARRVAAPVREAPVPPLDAALPRRPAHPRKLRALSERYGVWPAAERLVQAILALA